MLMTDMDKDDPEDRNKVTLMTVHSAKGLEYKYVYIVGLEENLFPSQRAAESPDGMEEERRLFYVALTRAKVEATISYAEMRFKWGNMEFSRPSCFLREIDPKYVRADFGTGTDDDRPHRSPDGSAPSAIDELRRRFDYRFQQKRQADRAGGNNGGQQGGFGGRAAAAVSAGVPPTAVRSRPALRAPRLRRARALRADPIRPRPDARALDRRHAPRGVRQAVDGGVPVGRRAVSGDYTVGQRVEHPKFGVGIVQRIETLATDHKLVVAFDSVGEKTLLAKFAS
ncbi:MAG: 3'-5' exonuclease [Alistipes sp.]